MNKRDPLTLLHAADPVTSARGDSGRGIPSSTDSGTPSPSCPCPCPAAASWSAAPLSSSSASLPAPLAAPAPVALPSLPSLTSADGQAWWPPVPDGAAAEEGRSCVPPDDDEPDGAVVWPSPSAAAGGTACGPGTAAVPYKGPVVGSIFLPPVGRGEAGLGPAKKALWSLLFLT